jgi:hypothetical protein
MNLSLMGNSCESHPKPMRKLLEQTKKKSKKVSQKKEDWHLDQNLLKENQLL